MLNSNVTPDLGKKQDPRKKDNPNNLQPIDRKIKNGKKGRKNEDKNENLITVGRKRVTIGPKKAKKVSIVKDNQGNSQKNGRKTKGGKKMKSKIKKKDKNKKKIVPKKIAKKGKEDSRVENEPEKIQPIDPKIREFCGKYFNIPDNEAKDPQRPRTAMQGAANQEQRGPLIETTTIIENVIYD